MFPILIITKAHNSVTIGHRVTVLVSFVKISRTVLELWSGHDFILIITQGHNSVNVARIVIVLVLFSAQHLITVYISTKFRENISNGFIVMERTRFVTDRQTDTQTDRQTFMRKTIYLPRRRET